MELWQRQGFQSFGDWRRASEKARRAARKRATSASSAAAAAACSSVSTAAPATPATPRASWQPLKSLQMPLAPNSPLGFRWEQLPGRLHEHVQVTPHGSRAHTMKHTSPGGTTRMEQYVSPVGAPQLTREERSAWRVSVAAARRVAAAAREEKAGDDSERNVWRFMCRPRCGTCLTCVELRRFGGSKHRASAPCESVLSRLRYTEIEREIVCDPKQRFARGYGCGQACAGRCGRKCERCHVCGRFWQSESTSVCDECET